MSKNGNEVLMVTESWSPTVDDRSHLRRRTVLSLAIAAAGLATPKVLLSPEPVAIALHRLFGGNIGMRRFGRIFCARQADAASRLLARLDGLDGSAVRSRIDAMRKEDFIAGRIVVINGWVLARTEAEACAFSAIT